MSRKYIGFSTLEILVVLSVFVVIGIITSQILFTTLKSTSKSQVTTFVKQNGSYAVAVMQRSLYNASSGLTCTTQTRVDYIDQDGNPAFFACIGAGTDSGHIASGSGNLSERLTAEELNITSCSVSCLPEFAPTDIEIKFTMQNKAGERPEEKSTIDFLTRVSLRN